MVIGELASSDRIASYWFRVSPEIDEINDHEYTLMLQQNDLPISAEGIKAVM